MVSALSGFVLIGAIVLAGWALRRWGGLPENAEAVLARVVWLVLTPCLLFTGVAASDLTALFSEPLLVSVGAALICFGLHALIVRGVRPGLPGLSGSSGLPGSPGSSGSAFRRVGSGELVLGALGAGYVNANYIGIPVATYVLGDATLVIPIIVLQLLIITPIALTLLELATTGHASARAAVSVPLRNPLVVATLLGGIVALTGLRLPSILLNPLTTIGQAAVPMVLIAFGMSLSGRRVLAPGPERAGTVTAVLLKTAAMPLIAFLLAAAWRLTPPQTYAVTVLAGLPTAQNIYLYAQRFRTGQILVRDTIFLTTVSCVPVLLSVTLLFHLW
ncbi:AEC family transporter [Actinoplanes awajinensis]|uniref:Transporter n=1 Tax=Actinoplanes awajinensis subsp. mycoplanecinus TaxID=135947 RepID=A0A101JBH1_9ACTN|nr:AEC family transporter [Actinoplanes awajinensis]KUL23701.1 transporter [Actinoplanes awajinensis subsp. mycoplanecinus]